LCEARQPGPQDVLHYGVTRRSLRLISFKPRTELKRKVAYEINAIETTRISIVHVSQCCVCSPISRAYFTFESVNSCYSTQLRCITRDHSCLALWDGNKLCKRKHHDLGSNKLEGELTQFFKILLHYFGALTYFNGRGGGEETVCSCVSGRSLVTAETGAKISTPCGVHSGFQMCSLLFDIPQRS